LSRHFEARPVSSVCKQNVKQGGADLRFLRPELYTSLETARPLTVYTGQVHRAVCLFTPQLSLVLVAPT